MSKRTANFFIQCKGEPSGHNRQPKGYLNNSVLNPVEKQWVLFANCSINKQSLFHTASSWHYFRAQDFTGASRVFQVSVLTQGTDMFGYRAGRDRREQQGPGPRLSLNISGLSMPMVHIWSICSPPLQDWRSPHSYKHARSGTNPNDFYLSITECLCLWLSRQDIFGTFYSGDPITFFSSYETFSISLGCGI